MTSQFTEQNYALIAGGVQRFPKSQTPVAASQDILFLLDFPTLGDDISHWPSQKPAVETHLSLVYNLADKLGVIERTHLEFALSDISKKGISNGALTAHLEKLEAKVKQLRPCCVVAFGMRATAALSLLTGRNIDSVDKECVSVGVHDLLGIKTELVLVPSARELQQFPDWRASVWQVLRAALTSVG